MNLILLCLCRAIEEKNIEHTDRPSGRYFYELINSLPRNKFFFQMAERTITLESVLLFCAYEKCHPRAEKLFFMFE